LAPKSTAVTPKKLVPVIMTVVPPATDPLFGLTLVTVGTANCALASVPRPSAHTKTTERVAANRKQAWATSLAPRRPGEKRLANTVRMKAPKPTAPPARVLLPRVHRRRKCSARTLSRPLATRARPPLSGPVPRSIRPGPKHTWKSVRWQLGKAPENDAYWGSERALSRTVTISQLPARAPECFRRRFEANCRILRKQRDLIETQRLRVAEHHVHVLDGLPRSALCQIVQG